MNGRPASSPIGGCRAKPPRERTINLKRVKEAVDELGDPKGKAAVMRHLEDVDHKVPGLSDTATQSVSRIEAFLPSRVSYRFRMR